MELHPSMIPGGSGDVGPGGHHRSEMRAVYRRPTLQGAGRSFEPDFMWVTRSSALITPILIEIEKPSKRWFRRGTGRPTSDFAEAHDQLNDWRTWFRRDQNMSVFRSQFVHDDQFQLPIEPQFVLIYGRASEFGPGGGHDDPDSLRRKRDGMRATDESFISFDSLAPRYDHRDSLTVTMTAKGPRIWAVSPHYGTMVLSGRDAMRLGSIVEALERSADMGDERRAYLAQRWQHWLDHARAEDAGARTSRIRRTGLE
jgi:hypothetical protein